MTIGSIQDLTLLYHFEPEVSPCGNAHLMQTIDNMRAALERSVAQEARQSRNGSDSGAFRESQSLRRIGCDMLMNFDYPCFNYVLSYV